MKCVQRRHTHSASTESKPAHTHKCDILPLSSSLLVISPLMVSDSVSLLTHTKHSGTARCNYDCSCHNTWSPMSPLTVGHEGGRQRRSNCWHRLRLCTMSVIRLGRDRWPTQAPQLALTNTHILKHTRLKAGCYSERGYSFLHQPIPRPRGHMWWRAETFLLPRAAIAGQALASSCKTENDWNGWKRLSEPVSTFFKHNKSRTFCIRREYFAPVLSCKRTFWPERECVRKKNATDTVCLRFFGDKMCHSAARQT